MASSGDATAPAGSVLVEPGPAAARSDAALDLHEESSHPAPHRHQDPAANGCPRWPEHYRLVNDLGEAVRGRCGATNQCAYCARLAAVENAELLALDALAGTAPRLWSVLTTRTATLDTRRFYRSREVVLRALRRRWAEVELACIVEFTTGYGARSGGQRRPHWNLLIKGVDPADRHELYDVVSRVWCAREDAEADAQFVGEIAEVGGLMRYLALHFQKESQKPPAGWRGHRLLMTRGYFAGSTAEARERARDSLRFKRELWRAIKAGWQGPDAELEARVQLAMASERTWRLQSLNLRSSAANRVTMRDVSPVSPGPTS